MNEHTHISDPSNVLNGDNMEQDLHQLLGYVIMLGMSRGPTGEMPTTQLNDFADMFLYKHRPQLDLAELREKNETRRNEWRRTRKTSRRTPLTFTTTELAGEVGELCNEIKKVERHTYGLVGGKSLEEALPKICDELADVVICADLVGLKLGINMPIVVREKFNKTSDKHGMSTKL